MTEVEHWLERHGLQAHAPSFRENGIGLDILSELSEDDLKELGLNLGDRRRFQAGLKSPTEPASRAAGRAAEAPEQTVAERRQLTVMFCDLAGSTALSLSMDPEQFREMIGRFRSVVSRSVGEFGGHIANYLGDGVLVYFGYPQANEDDAERAVRAGLRAVDAIGNLPGNSTPLKIRVGIATGLVVAGDLVGEGVSETQAVLGDTPNLAARLQGEAGPNEVVLSETTRRLVRGQFDLLPMAPRKLKGISEPVVPYKAIGVIARSRFEAASFEGLTPFVGRAAEFGLLFSCWSRAEAGEGQAILVCGEPGIGKSRLIEEFLTSVTQSSKTGICRLQCSAHYNNSPLYPVLRWLEQAAALGTASGDACRLQCLKDWLPAAVEDRGTALSLMAALFGLSAPGVLPPALSPDLQKERTLDLLAECILGEEATGSILVVEDVHWADATTLEWLGILITKIASQQRLLIVTFRPEFTPPWSSGTATTTLSLSRLSADDGRRIISEIVEHKDLPETVVERIVQRTDGVPLFVEELTKSVLESEFVEESDAGYQLTAPLTQLAIPDTLKDSLAARLDRLASAKEIAQIGACIGREFQRGLIAEVSKLQHDELDKAVGQLIESGLIFRRGSGTSAAYVFRHALVQDTAYGSILLSRRRQLHLMIADALEREEEPDPVALARHFSLAEQAEKAATYFLRAGEQSLARMALPEAEAQLMLGLAEALPASTDGKRLELELRAALGATRMAYHGWTSDTVLEALERAVMLAQELNEWSTLVTSLWGIWVNRSCVGDFAAAKRSLEELLRFEPQADSIEYSIVANLASAATNFWIGNYEASAISQTFIESHYDLDRDKGIVAYTMHDPRVLSLQWAGAFQNWVCGYPDRALAALEEMTDAARRLGHPFNLSFALTDGSAPLTWLGMSDLGVVRAEEALTIAKEHRLGFIENCIYKIFGGMQAFNAGQEQEGYRLMRDGVEFWASIGGRLTIGLLWTELAKAEAKVGNPDEALALVDRAIAFTEGSGEVWYLPESYRTKGDFLLLASAGDSTIDAAAACYRKANALAEAVGAKGWHLRAAMSLSQHYMNRGDRTRAYATLAPIYEWFAEGFNTPDLKQSEALLRELN